MMPVLKKVTVFVLAFFMLFSFVSCKKDKNEETTTLLSETTTAESESETAIPAVNPLTEETTTDNFRFTGNDAVLVGDMTSDIYGKLRVYYENNHFALIDEFDDVKFTFSAEGYAVGSVTVEQDEKPVMGDDMNFDGHSDLRIMYRKDGYNTYWLCWMWNMTNKCFDFFEPLASIPTPSFNKTAETVISYNQSSATQTSVVTYEWINGELSPTAHDVLITDNTPVTGPQDVDTNISVSDGTPYAYIVLNGNKNSDSSWICKIENMKIVKLSNNHFDTETAEQKFTFCGISPGTTTVLLRYATDWDADYVAEKILNVTVDENKAVYITVIE